eukprot:8340308-Alexandrium_andersonii.AAC.1
MLQLMEDGDKTTSDLQFLLKHSKSKDRDRCPTHACFRTSGLAHNKTGILCAWRTRDSAHHDGRSGWQASGCLDTFKYAAL